MRSSDRSDWSAKPCCTSAKRSVNCLATPLRFEISLERTSASFEAPSSRSSSSAVLSTAASPLSSIRNYLRPATRDDMYFRPSDVVCQFMGCSSPRCPVFSKLANDSSPSNSGLYGPSAGNSQSIPFLSTSLQNPPENPFNVQRAL